MKMRLAKRRNKGLIISSVKERVSESDRAVRLAKGEAFLSATRTEYAEKILKATQQLSGAEDGVLAGPTTHH